MISRRTALGGLLAAGALAAPRFASAQGSTTLPHPGRFGVETFSLANGLRVVVLPSARAPVVLHMVWYEVGGADEPAGQSGIAHFLEHLMFKGTQKTPPGEFSKIVARSGGRDNAFTSHDYTGYHQTVAADRLEMVMEMEADRMTNLVLTDKEVIPERDVVLEERRSRIENSPAALLDEAAREAMFGRRGYGIPVSGWPDEIRKLGVAEAIAFYRRFYAPNNAILIVAGDTSVEAVRRLAEKHYGPIARREVAPRVRSDQPGELPRLLVRRDQRVRQPQWGRDFLAPSYRMGETRHAYALQVAAQIIGGSQISRLYRSLVVEKKIAVGAYAGYSAGALGLSSFGFSATPAPQGDIATVEAAMTEEIDRFLQGGAREDEIVRAKRRLVAATVYARDSLATGPRLFGLAMTTGRTAADVIAWPDRIMAVTAAEIEAAVRAVLVPTRAVTTHLLPAET
ncbi:MAG: insulinase family protein [Alphaproteobacteria bacterium]|nr:insulinase family protein [Alphaproteobacteria bacterium]MCW5742134.1 insulinase family protein [Alphaproteobacteria bacterium]